VLNISSSIIHIPDEGSGMLWKLNNKHRTEQGMQGIGENTVIAMTEPENTCHTSLILFIHNEMQACPM